MSRWRPREEKNDIPEVAPAYRRSERRWWVSLAFLIGLTALALSGVMWWRLNQWRQTDTGVPPEGSSDVMTQVIQRLKGQTRALEAIKRDVEQIAKRLERLEKRQQRQEAQYRREIKKEREQITAMISSQQATFDQSLTALQKQINQFATEQESMKELLSSYNDVIMKLQKNMVILEKRIRGSERESAAAMQRIQALERSLNGAQNSIESLRRQVRGLEATIRDMEKTVDDLKASMRKSSSEALAEPE